MSDTPSRQETFSGTREVADRLRFDEKRLAEYLTAHADGFRGPLEVRQFKGGQSNPTYQLVTPTKKYVLRRKPPGKLLPSAHAVDREYRVITALGTTRFPRRAHLLPLRGRLRHRHDVLRDGLRRGRGSSGSRRCPTCRRAIAMRSTTR